MSFLPILEELKLYKNVKILRSQESREGLKR